MVVPFAASFHEGGFGVVETPAVVTFCKKNPGSTVSVPSANEVLAAQGVFGAISIQTSPSRTLAPSTKVGGFGPAPDCPAFVASCTSPVVSTIIAFWL